MIVSVSGANVALGATFPPIPGGGRYFVAGFIITASGATAGASVLARLANIDGVVGTLDFVFAFPIGAAVAAAPLNVMFNPPLPVVWGQAPVLSLPAGGGGNLNAAIVMLGSFQPPEL